MHELSLAMEVIALAERETATRGVASVSEIQIEVGTLSGVEADAFQWALEMLVRDSILDQAQVKIVRTPGTGNCLACQRDFEMSHRMATCPVCRCFPSEIRGGTEFRVVSLVVD